MRLVLAVAVAAISLRAQQAAPEPVGLDLLASDLRGRTVPALTAADLRVSDSGKAQRIIYFRAKQADDIFPQATVLLIDLFDAPDAFTPGAWNFLVQAIRAWPHPASLYCYVLTAHGMLFPVHALPNSWIGAPLGDESWARESMPSYETVADLKQPFRKELEAPAGEYSTNSTKALSSEGARGLVRLTAIQELEARMVPVPGPATLILWGRPARGKLLDEDLANYIATTSGDRVPLLRIYTVGSPKPAFASATVLLRFPGATSLRLPSSDPGEVLKLVWRELEPRYRIAWLPGPDNWDGRMHQVEVKSARPEVSLAYGKHQYRAPTPGDLATNQQTRQPDLFALAPHDSTMLRLTATAGEVRVNANDVLFLPVSGGYTVKLAVQWFRYSADPPAKISDPRVLEVHFTEAERTRALASGIRVAEQVPPSTHAARVRVVVSDMGSGAFGTLTMGEQR